MIRLTRHLTTAAGLVLSIGIACIPNPVVGAGQGKIPGEAYQRLNEALVEHHVLPRYARLAATAGRLDDAARSLCEARDGSALGNARDAYHATMDAWMGIQHIQFGPVEYLMRSFRLYFWPQGRGKVGAAITELVAAQDRGMLVPDQFRHASVAVQGLPAIEYLLFVAPESLTVYPGSVKFPCEVLKAATMNVREMAAAVLDDWRGRGAGQSSFAAMMLAPGPDNAIFSTPKDVTLAFFNSLHGGLRIVADLKLKPVIGKSRAAARPKLAESRSSDRATRNINLNLQALQALYTGEDGAGLGGLVKAYGADTPLDPLIRKAFRLTLETVRSIDLPLDQASVDRSLRSRSEKLLIQAMALKRLVRTRVAAAIGLTVGFNALDGD